MTAYTEQPTLDGLFARALARAPDAIALADGMSHDNACGRPALRLTFAQADRAISAIAGQLQRLGLKTDHVVALQMPNSVEAVLTLLGILRAGMIAAPVPLLWRRTETVAALSRIGAKAIITLGRVGETDLAELATHIAAEVFQIRAVGAFGGDLPDGVIAFDPLLESEETEPVAAVTRRQDPAAHLAVITFDTDTAGPVPVARNHAELLAAGLAVANESAIAPGRAIFTTFPPSSLAGLATGLVPWLAAGEKLCLHRPFDAAALGDQLATEDGGVLVIPGPLAQPLCEAGVFAHAPGLHSIIAVWRAPERLATAADWRDTARGLVDLQAFGEVGLVAARRGGDGRPSPIAIGPVMASHATSGSMPVAELARTASGTLAIRGPMTPRFCYPPGADRGDPPFLKLDEAFFIDTGHPCRVEPGGGAMIVTAPPAGLVGIGGYRIALGAYQQIVEETDADATLAALPDMLTGQRLAGRSSDDEALRDALLGRGVNPLIIGAFRDRRAAEISGETRPGRSAPADPYS